jgi:hypothetical protein
MAAGLGFKTFTTGEVLTAADTNGYLMQGVNVFADAAARTAAITSPEEGQMSYLKDTNSTEYYTGAAWAAIGSSGAMTLLSTTTLSGASTTISSISGSYIALKIFIYGVTNNTANGNFTLSMNSLGNNNNYAIIQYNNNGSTATRNLNNEAITFNLAADQYNRTSANNFISLSIENYASAATMKSLSLQGYYVGASFNEGLNGGGGFNSTAAINQIVLSNSGGTFSAGTVLIYGVK